MNRTMLPLLALLSFVAANDPLALAGKLSKSTKATPASTLPISLTISQPPYGFNVLPGSVRRVFATVTNGTTNQIGWTVKGGTATLSASTGSWVDITAPAAGSTCSYTGSSTAGWKVASAKHFTLEATSLEDRTKTASITINICSQNVQVTTVPFYRTLYASQQADIQSLILGASNENVTWRIKTQPLGGDGVVGDSTKRDTVFSATVPGRYYLVATSVADPTKTATTILYVTGHKMPYLVTPNLTEPVDCTVDPANLGQVYEVGPNQAWKTLASVPFPTMVPGSTVRLHNEDTTGLHPTEYHEYVQIQAQAAADQPFRMCGVPDSAGHLPIMDASNATGRSDTSYYAAGFGLITLHHPGYWSYYPGFSSAEYVAVEGIQFRNAKAPYTFTGPDGSQGTWTNGSGIYINQVRDASFVGNEYSGNGNGVFTGFNGNGGYGNSSMYILWEGSNFHDNGVVGSFLYHQAYLQAWGEIVQFNRIADYTQGAEGSNLKSRGIQSVIRYNYLGDGAARQMDLVDVEDAPQYMSFEGMLGQLSSPNQLDPKELYPPDLIAAEQEAWNSHFVYGNIYNNSSSAVPIHFSYDHNANEQERKGSLYWYNNTFYEKLCPICTGQNWTLFDTSGGGGNYSTQVEWNTVQAFNNIVWMDDPGRPIFQWNNYEGFIGVAGNNLLPTNWGTNNKAGGLLTGWNVGPHPTAYQNATNLALHLTGFDSGDIKTTSTIPFDTTTWYLKTAAAGSIALPASILAMPTRYAYMPTLNYAVPRTATPSIGATDLPGAVPSATGTPAIPCQTVYRFGVATCLK